MSTLTPVIASGSTNGRLIKVGQVETPGTLIHTAVTGTTSIDQILVYACNTGTATQKLTIEWGGTTAPDDLIEVGIAGESGLVLVVPQLRLNNGAVVRAFAAAANVVNIACTVDRWTP